MFWAPILYNRFYNTLRTLSRVVILPPPPPLMSLGGKQSLCLRFLKYCKNFISAPEMPIYFRLYCLLYLPGGGVDASQANLLKKALVAAFVVMAHTIATSQVQECMLSHMSGFHVVFSKF